MPRRFFDALVKLAPLVKQAWPILAAIVAVISDAFGATGGAATGAAVGLLAASQVAGDRRRISGAEVDALAAPLRLHGDVAELPVFEFHPERGRLRAVAVSLHGRKYDLENGPPLFIDATAIGLDDEDDLEIGLDLEDEEDPHVATIPPGVD